MWNFLQDAPTRCHWFHFPLLSPLRDAVSHPRSPLPSASPRLWGPRGLDLPGDGDCRVLLAVPTPTRHSRHTLWHPDPAPTPLQPAPGPRGKLGVGAAPPAAQPGQRLHPRGTKAGLFGSPAAQSGACWSQAGGWLLRPALAAARGIPAFRRGWGRAGGAEPHPLPELKGTEPLCLVFSGDFFVPGAVALHCDGTVPTPA